MNLQEFYNKYGRDLDFIVDGKSLTQPKADCLHLYDLVWHYKNQMIHWFDSLPADQENPMSCVTQEHWYSMYLEKKRLEKRRLHTHHKSYFIRPTDYRYSADKRVTEIKYFSDGNYVVNKLTQKTWIDIRYFRDNVLVGKLDKSCETDYYIMRSSTANGMYLCPNCGVEMPLEKLLDGCDYCNSKFDISAYNDKVISVARVFNRHDRRSNEGYINFWNEAFKYSFEIPITYMRAFPPLLLLMPLALLITGITAAATIPDLKKEHEVHNHFLQQIRSSNPGISIEEFISSLDSKLKSIHFADHPQDVAAFVKCNIAPYLMSNQSIIRCELGRFMIKGYRTDDRFQYITLHRSVRVWTDCGNKMKKDLRIVQVTLAKQRDYKHKSDISMFTCQHCGATISLTEGGVCKYCGTMMDYDAYDWVIIDYKFVK